MKYIEVPHYDELAVKNIWPQFVKDEKLSSYFPDAFAKNRGPAREYFFNVLNTVHPDYLGQLMTHANT